MWIIQMAHCLFQGHAYIDICYSKPYRYCLRCGKINESVSDCKNRALHSSCSTDNKKFQAHGLEG